jgi:molecular chaperone GrpE
MIPKKIMEMKTDMMASGKGENLKDKPFSETENISNDNKKLSGRADKVEPPVDEGGIDGMGITREQLKVSEEEAKKNYDRYLRLAAEFDNFKKRSAREMDEFRKFANESLIQDLLPIVDNLERAIQSIKDEKGVNHQILDGIHMTIEGILKVFEKFKVKPIEAIGERFDPSFHQAVMQEETDLQPENTVLNELQKGYMIHDRLLRPSMVVVSKTSKENDKQ